MGRHLSSDFRWQISGAGQWENGGLDRTYTCKYLIVLPSSSFSGLLQEETSLLAGVLVGCGMLPAEAQHLNRWIITASSAFAPSRTTLGVCMTTDDERKRTGDAGNGEFEKKARVSLSYFVYPPSSPQFDKSLES